MLAAVNISILEGCFDVEVLHRSVVKLGGLPVVNAPALLSFIEKEEVDNLAADEDDEGASEAHSLLQVRPVLRRILLIEEQGPNDVAGRDADVEERHDDGALGGACNVGDHLRDE